MSDTVRNGAGEVIATSEDDGSVYERVASVIGDLPAIGKDSWNEQQKFHFRGIDDVLNALKPLLAKHGVFFAPDVLERLSEERTTRSGGAMHVVHLHVSFTFYGAGGDSFSCSAWGEGTDSGDKATNKAMTGAMKYMLGQVFAISTADTVDSDATSPEAEYIDMTPRPAHERLGYPDEAALQLVVDEFTLAGHQMSDEQRAAFKQWRTENTIGWPVPFADVEKVRAHLATMPF